MSHQQTTTSRLLHKAAGLLRRRRYDPDQPVAAIKRAMIDQGAVDIELDVEPEVVAVMYASLARLLSEAPNYSESSVTIKPAGVVEAYTVTVQRANGKTPHQLRHEAEIEATRLRDALAGIASRRCPCSPPHYSHGGPCCGVAGGRCVTCEARHVLDTITEGT